MDLIDIKNTNIRGLSKNMFILQNDSIELDEIYSTKELLEVTQALSEILNDILYTLKENS